MPKFDLSLQIPLVNAAGSLGFVPDPYGRVDLKALGAFITNPVSLRPRAPAKEKRFIAFSGGFLLHTGFPNPGLKAVIRRCAAPWARSPVPVWLHLIAHQPAEVFEMVQRLERVEGVMGVEVGLPPGVDAETALEFARAAGGELPALLRLPFESARELAGPLAAASAETGLAAVSLAPPRGLLFDSLGNPIQGRLYGPGIFPLALAAVQFLVKTGLPVIGAGGVYRPSDIEAMLSAGAAAVQLDSMLWRSGLRKGGE